MKMSDEEKVIKLTKLEDLNEQLERLFEEASVKIQRRAIYKVCLQNWSALDEVQRQLNRIENTQMMLDRENKRAYEESEMQIV